MSVQTQFEVEPWSGKPIKFAWPGGYPVFYLCREGYRDDDTGELEFNRHDRTVFVCCAGCLPKGSAIAIASEVNWEDPGLTCEVCSERIESAYAEDEVEGGAS